MKLRASSSCDADGGDSGLLRGEGRGPGEQKGRCLLGTGAGVPRGEVLMERGGVAVRPGGGAALVQTVVAITLASFQCRVARRYRSTQDLRYHPAVAAEQIVYS